MGVRRKYVMLNRIALVVSVLFGLFDIFAIQKRYRSNRAIRYCNDHCCICTGREEEQRH